MILTKLVIALISKTDVMRCGLQIEHLVEESLELVSDILITISHYQPGVLTPLTIGSPQIRTSLLSVTSRPSNVAVKPPVTVW